MISQLDGPEDTLRRKRLKVTNACTECRRRKTKCDGSRPCASCSKAKVECQYVSSSRNNSNNSKSQQKHTTAATASSSTSPTTTTIFASAEPNHLQQLIKPSEDHRYRRLSSNLQQPTITNMRSSSVSSIAIATPLTAVTPRPSSSRHSFSHLASPHPGYSEEQYNLPPPSTTIASIEERLEKIERILWMILEKNTSPLDHRPILTDEESNPGATTVSHDSSIRLPPLYNHHHHHHLSPSTPSPCFGNTKTLSSTISTPSIRSLLDSETSNAPPPSSSSPSSPSSPPSVIHILKPAGLSSPSLPPVITALHSPHDPATTTGQHFLQPNNNTNTSIIMTSPKQSIIQSSSSSSSSAPSPHTPSSNDHYQIQHSIPH